MCILRLPKTLNSPNGGSGSKTVTTIINGTKKSQFNRKHTSVHPSEVYRCSLINHGRYYQSGITENIDNIHTKNIKTFIHQ